MAGRPALPRPRRRPRPSSPAVPRELRGLGVETQGPGEPPEWWIGTRPEWWAYWALLRLGKQPDVDFSFQSSLLGGRLAFGGQVVDFLMLDPPGLALNIQGVFWHYGRGSAKLAEDRLERDSLARQGIQVVYLDEDDLERNPVYYVQQALAGIDHSRISRGIG